MNAGTEERQEQPHFLNWITWLSEMSGFTNFTLCEEQVSNQDPVTCCGLPGFRWFCLPPYWR